MQLEKYFTKYISSILLKLLLLGVVIVIIHLLIIYSFGRLLSMKFSYEALVALIPLISFIAYLLVNRIILFFQKNKAKWGDSLCYCKYNLLFPFYFSYDPNPKKNERVEVMSIKEKIKPGDILLRRYHRHLDGLIFSENSYFTHAGIYVSAELEVLHCTTKGGVQPISLEKFCECDDVAVLRFSFKQSPIEEKTHNYIIDKKQKKEEELLIQQEEEIIFNELMQTLKPISSVSFNQNITRQKYMDVILKRAKSLIGKPYDMRFNFNNFNSFSCIEYVWYCFKCLFPLHRIRVKDFEFLGFINVPVIIPDVFVKNDFFDCIYSSIQGVGSSKKKLMDFVNRERWPFWKFVSMVLVWDVIFLFTWHFFFKS